MAQEPVKSGSGAEPEQEERASSSDLDAEQGSLSGQPAAEGEEPQNRRARRAAASQARKQRIREREDAEAVGLDAQEILDDAFVRSSDRMGKWLRRNSGLLQGVLVAGLAVWAGWGIYGWRLAKAQQSASHVLAAGLDAERGKIGDPAEQGKLNDQKIIDPTPIFADHAARLKAAEEALRQAAQERSGSGTSLYAQLAQASVLLDSGKHDEAKALFEELQRSPLASQDVELRGRAIEGVALVLEAKGDKAGALKTYQTLENVGALGFTELALYEQARLQRDLGQLDAARETLKKLNTKVGAKASDAFGFSAGYVERGMKSLSEELGVELSAPTTGAGADALQQLQKQLELQLGTPSGSAAAPTSTAP